MDIAAQDLLLTELMELKKTNTILVGDRIKDADESIQMVLAEKLGYAVGKTQAGRSFRLINPRKTIVPGSAGVIFNNDQSRILMQERWGTDSMWEPCGGGLRFGESLRDNVLREALEETGYSTVITNFIGLFGSPTEEEILVYPDQEHRHCVLSIFALEAVEKVKEPDVEVTDLQWFEASDVMVLPMLPIHRRIMEIALTPKAAWPVVV